MDALHGKWRRRDVLSFIEEYAGISRAEIYQTELDKMNDTPAESYCKAELEAIEALGAVLLETAAEIVEKDRAGHLEDLLELIDPVKISKRPDGMTGKVRDIANLCIMHHLIGHLAILIMEPFLHARIMPTQHASIPGRGQTRLKDQVRKFIHSTGLGIRRARKIDGHRAYASVHYSDVIKIVETELPSATELRAILRFLAMLAPGGVLIIGGYPDAWFFNLIMSYCLRHAMKQHSTRRGKKIPYIIRADAYMDDVCFMTTTRKGMERGIKAFRDYAAKEYGLEIRFTTGEIELLSIDEEKRRRAETRPGRRGCPGIDLAGFEIYRTHIRIRPRVYRRARRQFLRAAAEVKATGTMRIQRAQRLISYYGYFKQTDAIKARRALDADRLLKIAKKIVGHFSRVEIKKKKEEIYHAFCRSMRKRYAAARLFGGTA